MKEALLKTVKKGFNMCHKCETHILKDQLFLLLQNEETKKEQLYICQKCAPKITKEEWKLWGFGKDKR